MQSTVDESIRRSYFPHFLAGRFDPSESVEWESLPITILSSKEHLDIAHDAALQSFVLLKNDGVLPLRKGIKVAVVGPTGISGYSLLSDYFGYEVCFGGGYDCITTLAQGINATNSNGITYAAKGVDINSNDTSGIDLALTMVNSSDYVILTLGIDKTIEREEVDRIDTALPGLQESFANMVLAVGKPTVLVLVNGGAIAFDNLIAAPNAIIEAYNPSMAGGMAMGATIFGDSNKWGKLVIFILIIFLNTRLLLFILMTT